MKLFITTLLFIITNAIFSQEYTIKGKVVDSKTGETLPSVIVKVQGTSIVTTTDIDGKYELKHLSLNMYTITFTYVSFKTKTVENVKLVEGKPITMLDVNLEADQQELSEVIITEAKITNTEGAVVNEIKKSENVVSGISAVQISKSQDRDAADVVKRIPGVTIMDNRFIMVRGLYDRYNTVWLNDASAPSSETDKKSFSFDIIPSGLIDRILIYKTASPELPGDFAGGMVKIYTKAFPQKSNLTVNLQSSYRPGSTGNTFYYTQGSKTDYLGYDNGFRSIPQESPEYISKNDDNNNDVSKAFKNTWAIMDKKAQPDVRFGLTYSKIIYLKKIKIGNTTGFSYSNVNTVFNIHRQDWDSVAPIFDYSDIQSTNTAKTGIIENISLLTDRSKFEFKNLFNQTGRAQTTLRTSNFVEAADEKSYVLSYQDKKTYSSQLSGEHKSGNDRTIYGWTLGYANNTKNDPDLRRIKYTKQRTAPDSMYKAQVANVVDPVNGGGRFYSTLNEKVYSFGHNFKQKIFIKDYSFELNLGSFVEYKSRIFKARVLGYVINPGFKAFNLTRLPIDQIFSPDNVGVTGGFKMDEITNLSDAYTAQNKLLANYISLSLPVGEKIKVAGGVRAEHNVQSLQSYVNIDSISPSVKTFFMLPSVNASYNFTEKSLLRLAYGKTLNRPEFREWSPFYFYDFDFRAGTYGSLFPTVLSPQGNILDVAKIYNYDLRYELYPTSGEFMHVGLFYKKFIDPIQQIVLTGGSDSKAFSYINAESAYVTGLEIDVRKNLLFLDEKWNTNFFSNLGVVANLSLMKSQVNLSKVINQETATPLQGQSPYVINTGLYYQNDSIGLQISLLYNVFGPRIFLIGTLDYANIGEMPRHTLDFTISQNITKTISFNFGIQDLLNQPVLLIQDTNNNNKFESKGDDKEILSYKKGSYYTLGIRLKI